MIRRPIPFVVLLLALSFSSQVLAQLVCPSPHLPGDPTTYSGNGGAAQNVSNCNGFECATPILQGGPFFHLEGGCDPNVSACDLTVEIQLEFPGNSLNPTGLHSRVFWFTDQFSAPNSTGGCFPLPPPLGNNCNFAASCGLEGQELVQERGNYFLDVGAVSCAELTDGAPSTNPLLQPYVVAGISCNFRSAQHCVRRLNIPVDLTEQVLAQELGCKEPPPDDCNTDANCQTCLLAGGSGGAGASGGGGGGSWGGGPQGESGPGAQLRHRAGGVGGDGFPGTSAWRTELGLYWSHDYAKRIVQDPDDSRVWLLTQGGSFRRFTNLVGGVYQTASPTDEYRTLTRTASGWELTELDGRVHAFDALGRWASTTDRFDNEKVAIYNGANQLETVTFPDHRIETFDYRADGKLVSITEVGTDSSTSRTWTYTWTLDELDRIDRPDGTALEFFYQDAAFPGYLTRVEKVGTLGGRRVEAAWEYDPLGNAVAIWRGDAVKTGPAAIDLWELSFDDTSLPSLTTVTDPLGATSTYTLERDENSRKPKLTALSGACPACSAGPNTQFAYNDPNHPLRPTLETDAKNHSTEMTYDAFGQLLTRTEAMGETEERTTTWTYHPTFPALVTEMQQPSTAGGTSTRVTTFTYNSSGALTERLEEGVEMPGGAYAYATAFTPSPEGLNLVVDPPGYNGTDQTTFTYDLVQGSLLVATRTDPLIGSTAFEYDALNRRTKVIDPNLVETETAYDLLDRVITITQRGAIPADNLVTTHSYNEFGDLFRTQLPEGNLIEYVYDASGRLTSVERKANAATPGERTVYVLDTIGNRTREELQRWNGGSFETRSSTDFEYQNRCQLQAVAFPDGTKTEYAYDCEGNLERVWDANHPSAGQTEIPTTQYTYDALDRLTQASQRWGGSGGGFATTLYGYDVQDHLTSVTDPELNLTTYAYSDRNLLTSETSPVSGVTNHLYNEHGELTQSTDARGVVTTRTIDELNRVTSINYGSNPNLTTQHTYDDPQQAFSKGRLTRIKRGGVFIDYSYDRFGRLIQDGALAFTYDKNGNRLNLDYPGGLKAVYTFDFADRPESLTVQRTGFPNQVVASGGIYEPNGPLKEVLLGNGRTETRGFDARYFPTDLQVGGASTILDWTYTTDSMGNISMMTDSLDPAQTRAYAYQDFQYFLTSGVGPWGTLGWTYDKIGNRLSETRDGSTDIYSYVLNGGGGRTALLDTVQIPGVGTRTYQYDNAGNQTGEIDPQQGTLTLTYDEAGRLSSLPSNPGSTSGSGGPMGGGPGPMSGGPGGGGIVLSAPRVELTYDGRSFLSSALVPSTHLPQPQDGVEATYTSNGLFLQRRDILATDPALSVKDQAVLYFAGRPIAIFERNPFAIADPGTLIYLTTDHLGTPVLATNSAGQEIWSGGFEPFGQDFAGAEAAGIFLRFPGQWNSDTWLQTSPEGGIYYNVHRWYAPGSGRYSKVDPLGLEGDINPFAYAASNGIVFSDPLGLKARLCCKSIGQGRGRSGFLGTIAEFVLKIGSHCYVEKEEGGKRTTWGLHHVRGGYLTFGDGRVRRNAPFDFAGDAGECGEWNESCAVDQCVDRTARSYPGGTNGVSLYNFLTGPNSNTFARNQSDKCNLSPPPVAGSWRTPGWNSPPTSARRRIGLR
ncbi:MAG: hypothetical protein K0U98_08000 [Deltaproteobacteria bacterium]|nr:hypothetical protein [Deltaproteobacteria bacterium]